MATTEPTDRELLILEVLWQRGEATVREVYEALRDQLPIVQNTVQSFLRTMTDKGLVTYRNEGRTFIYRPLVEQEQTSRRMLDRLMKRLFDGSLDQLVASAVSLREPSREELDRLRELLDRPDRDRPDPDREQPR